MHSRGKGRSAEQGDSVAPRLSLSRTEDCADYFYRLFFDRRRPNALSSENQPEP
jgi:hypothetical protein